MKKLNATFDIENDLEEHKLRNVLEGMNAKYVKTLADTDHLKNNTTYKKLLKAKKEAQLKLDRYVNDNR
ncbi:MAG: hypothetical protein GY928_02240 [Colwellia sp.]|nr:hypothetical protein [Colwellia sp.]